MAKREELAGEVVQKEHKKETTKKTKTNKNVSNKRIEEVIEKVEEIAKEENKKQKNEIKTSVTKNKKEKQEPKEDKKKKDSKVEENKKKETKKEENKKALIVKNETAIDEVKLEEIEEEIKKQTTISEEKKKKINKKIFQNIIVAIVIVLYFIFLNLGYYNLEGAVYLKDLQVFSIITIGITIIIFEKAYKKDSTELAIYGIESLILSICTLMTIYIGVNYKEKFTYILNSISMLFAIYYVGKSIIIYIKLRKKALKRVSDINKIGRVK